MISNVHYMQAQLEYLKKTLPLREKTINVVVFRDLLHLAREQMDTLEMQRAMVAKQLERSEFYPGLAALHAMHEERATFLLQEFVAVVGLIEELKAALALVKLG